jgi:hypothetical protein
MPEIEITPEQEERLRALQEEIARDVVGKYGHVRPRDAVEYLLDRYEDDAEADPGGEATAGTDGAPQSAESTDAEEAGDDGTGDGEADAEEAGGDEAGGGTGDAGATTRVVAGNAAGDGSEGGDDGMLDEMMSLLDTHDDRWGESDGDERYAVELPDGSTERVRTKDDVKALLFEHYR